MAVARHLVVSRTVPRAVRWHSAGRHPPQRHGRDARSGGKSNLPYSSQKKKKKKHEKETQTSQPETDKDSHSSSGSVQQKPLTSTQQSSSSSSTSTSRFASFSKWLRSPYTRDKYSAMAQRGVPLLLVACAFAYGEELAQQYILPFSYTLTYGPSMLPTVHPLGDIWLHTTPLYEYWRRQGRHLRQTLPWGSPSSDQPQSLYNIGDIVLWKDPKSGQCYCKRIVGVAGSTVQRYGEFVHLYEHHADRGIRWNRHTQQQWDPTCPWDYDKHDGLAERHAENGHTARSVNDHAEDDMASQQPQQKYILNQPNYFNNNDDITRHLDGTDEEQQQQQQQQHSYEQALAERKELHPENYRTLVVPKGHVWLEGDNPLLSIDSRHYGPIPETFIQGRLLWRLWPLTRRPMVQRHDQLLLRHRNQRPKPLQLEVTGDQYYDERQEDFLALNYNLHRVHRPAQEGGDGQDDDEDTKQQPQFKAQPSNPHLRANY